MPAAGRLECSDPMVTQLISNITWGQRGNYVSVPTDCPQRDERLGWTADTQIFLPTACFQADVAAFIGRWLLDVLDDPRTAAFTAGRDTAGSCGWTAGSSVAKTPPVKESESLPPPVE